MADFFGWADLRSPKTALLCEGGGQLGIYGVGALQCFHDNGVTFPYYIGVSAAAANLASHLAGHRDRTVRFYADYALRPAYMGWRCWRKTGSFIDLGYIYDVITNHEDPLDYDTLCAVADEIRIVVTNARTGRAEYFGNSAFAGRECKALMASSALPVYCKPVEIAGELYFDGGVADSLPVERALEEGCARVVAILNRPPGFRKTPEKGRRLYPLALRQYPEIAKALALRHENYMRSLRRLEQLEAEGRAVLIRPAAALPMHTFTRRPAALLRQVCRMGYDDARRALFCAAAL
ncbi:MAG: patatin family protein [Oscillospiraceae bacterium]|jgi:predicted patatin/cPLA2 family phospholipase|nr:patatin family protein [Oscillospiraceae bacterium]